MFRVLLAQYCVLCRYLPVDTQAVVKDTDAAVRLGMVELIALVLEHRRLAQHGKTVRKAFRNEELSVVVLRQFNRDVLAVCWRAFPYINCNVEDFSPYTFYQFCLCIWRTLEMQSTHYSIR